MSRQAVANAPIPESVSLNHIPLKATRVEMTSPINGDTFPSHFINEEINMK
jgi:hypothetical protein